LSQNFHNGKGQLSGQSNPVQYPSSAKNEKPAPNRANQKWFTVVSVALWRRLNLMKMV